MSEIQVLENLVEVDCIIHVFHIWWIYFYYMSLKYSLVFPAVWTDNDFVFIANG